MVNLTIDGKQNFRIGKYDIMEAARQNGIPIPKLCYLKGSMRSQPVVSVW